MKHKLLFTSLALLFFSVIAFSQYEAEFQSRKDTIFRIMAKKYYNNTSGAGFTPNFQRPPGYWVSYCNGNGGVGDFGKFTIPRMIVAYEQSGLTGGNADTCNMLLVRWSVPACGLFHFNFPGIIKLLYGYPNAPGVLQTKKTYLQKVFNQTDGYNAFTCEGTENHIFMSRPPAYLFAQLAIDSFPADFPTAPAKLDSMKKWIMTVSKKLYASGAGEFNSTTYEPYSINGWLMLYDYAKDPDVKAAAHAVLDYYATELALHYTQGLQGGSDMRGKGQTKGFDYNAGATTWLAWLWFGDQTKYLYSITTNFNKEPIAQSVYAATSNYRPPIVAVKLARKELSKPAMYYNSKGDYLLGNSSYIKQTFYIDNGFTLGAAYFPYGGWASGDWQMVSWKLIGRVNFGATKDIQYASGQGMVYYNGGNYRSPFDQLIHHKNVLIQLTKVPTNAASISANLQTLFTTWANSWDIDYASRFGASDTKYSVNGGITASSGRKTPISFQNPAVTDGSSFMDIIDNTTATLTTTTQSNIFFVQLEKVFLAIRSINSTTPTFAEPKLTDAASTGNLSGFVLEARNASDFADFTTFRTTIVNNTSLIKITASDSLVYTSSFGDVIQVKYNTSGTFTEPIYDWGYGPTIQLVTHTTPPFIQPTWPTGAGHGKLATWKVNGTPVNLSTNWPVYSGPHLTLANNILTLNDSAGTSYSVDYTGPVPVFNLITETSKTIQQKQYNNELKLYPNPSKTGIFYFTEDFTGKHITVTDLTGKILLQQIQNNKELNLEKLKPGIYIISVYQINNRLTTKIIIE